jgi:hypothetical protein
VCVLVGNAPSSTGSKRSRAPASDRSSSMDALFMTDRRRLTGAAMHHFEVWEREEREIFGGCASTMATAMHTPPAVASEM